MKNEMTKLSCWIRALRLPFITASILPFIAGTFLFKGSVCFLTFSTGLISVIATHLGANLINDYADSKSGADWHDKKFYGLFGGSKLIQEGVLSEKTYLLVAVILFLIAFVAVFFLSYVLHTISVIGFYLLILIMGVAYSQGPLRFSYRYLGEVVIFILFGPALVMGGYFIQRHVFPSTDAFILSLPFGLLTTAILFANEVPDYKGDLRAKKFTWVKLVGADRAYLMYYFLMFAAIAAIVLNIRLGALSWLCLISLACSHLIIKAGAILKTHYNDKSKLVEASKLTIFVQTLIGLLVALDLIL
ncbi:MAG: prenyltransferase [Candidatus Omnitrophica bacterium]|nr:prenyltransferase [Candidatus Omnitrophota bacterium]